MDAEIDTSNPTIAAVEFSYFSADGEEGFPGNVHSSVRFALTPENELTMRYGASTDLITPINLTNHAYFNLAGAGSGTILDHVLQIHADAFTPTDDGLILLVRSLRWMDRRSIFAKPRESATVSNH